MASGPQQGSDDLEELRVLPHLLRLPNGEGVPQNTVTERHGN